jgi:hypothetical protein
MPSTVSTSALHYTGISFNGYKRKCYVYVCGNLYCSSYVLFDFLDSVLGQGEIPY